MRRYFYRCFGCLEVTALADQLPMTFSQSIAVCENCGQHFEYMGRVQRDHLVMDETKCKCDDRCLSAKGPLCSCSCGGENHGAGMAGYITVPREVGAVPVVSLTGKHREKAAAQYREFHAAIQAVLAAIDAYSTRRAQGEFLPRDQWCRWQDMRQALRKARKAKTHASRMKSLTPFLAQAA